MTKRYSLFMIFLLQLYLCSIFYFFFLVQDVATKSKMDLTEKDALHGSENIQR